MKANNLKQLQKIAKENCDDYTKAYSVIGNKVYGVKKDGTYYVGQFGDYGLCPFNRPNKNQVVIE